MTTVELLIEAEKALNKIPNKSLSGAYKNTYELASAIGQKIKDLKAEGPEADGTQPEQTYADKIFSIINRNTEE
jgi:hypothetical protein